MTPVRKDSEIQVAALLNMHMQFLIAHKQRHQVTFLLKRAR